MNLNGPWLIVVSSVVVYLFIIAALRLFGKKELAQLSVTDLVFILLISNSVQNAMVGQDSSLTGGLIAASALFLTNFILKFLIFRSHKFSEILQGDPLFLIYRGKIDHKALDRAKISMEELDQAIREHGVSGAENVNLAVLEVDGSISVLSDSFKKQTTRKRRLPRVLKKNN